MAALKRHTTPHRAQTGAGSENISLDEPQLNDYAAQVAKGHGMDPRARTVLIVCVVLACVYAVGLVVPKDMLNEALHYAGYNQGYSFAWFVQSLQENVAGLAALLSGTKLCQGRPELTQKMAELIYQDLARCNGLG